VVEVSHHECVFDAISAQLAQAILEAPAVHEARETIGRRLHLRLGHHAEHAEAVPGLVRQHLHRCDRGEARCLVDLAGGVDDADRPAHDRHGHAHARAAPPRPFTQHRACVDLFAVGEHLGLCPSGRHALVGRVDAAARRVPVGRRHHHTLEVGVAVVGDEQLDRPLGAHGVHGATDHIEGIDLVVAHLEPAGEPGLELTSLRVLAHRPFLGRLRAPTLDGAAPGHHGNGEEERDREGRGDRRGDHGKHEPLETREQALGDRRSRERGNDDEPDAPDRGAPRRAAYLVAGNGPVLVGDHHLGLVAHLGAPAVRCGCVPARGAGSYSTVDRHSRGGPEGLPSRLPSRGRWITMSGSWTPASPS